MAVTIFQHQFYLMHTLLTESSFIPLWLFFFFFSPHVKKRNKFYKNESLPAFRRCQYRGVQLGGPRHENVSISHDTPCFPVLLGFCAAIQTMYQGQASDVECRVIGMSLT